MDDKFIDKIVANIERVILGKQFEIYRILKGILCAGHILLEDVPGVGKTTLVKALAKTFDLTFSRIQFTPDLLPSDITGISIYNQKSGAFEYKKGPIFANIVLADEINRTSPKTQSALLEVMEEAQVSEGNHTYKLDKPFFVIATQNPIEYEGTFPLPEAQLDRFTMKIKIGYANKKKESEILAIYREHEPLQEISAVCQKDDLLAMQAAVREIHVSKPVTEYIVDIVDKTRNSELITLGASTRAALALMKVAQAEAYLNHRSFVTPENIRDNAEYVLSHRITLSPYARANNLTNEAVISEIVRTTIIPRETEHAQDQ
jgi:MoxR-like ATPase